MCKVHRITATTSQSHDELSLPFLEAGQGGGWGCGPEQLAATVPSALFTVVYGEAHTAFRRVLLIF
jgi:hypothetical protein